MAIPEWFNIDPNFQGYVWPFSSVNGLTPASCAQIDASEPKLIIEEFGVQNAGNVFVLWSCEKAQLFAIQSANPFPFQQQIVGCQQHNASTIPLLTNAVVNWSARKDACETLQAAISTSNESKVLTWARAVYYFWKNQAFGTVVTPSAPDFEEKFAQTPAVTATVVGLFPNQVPVYAGTNLAAWAQSTNLAQQISQYDVPQMGMPAVMVSANDGQFAKWNSKEPFMVYVFNTPRIANILGSVSVATLEIMACAESVPYWAAKGRTPLQCFENVWFSRLALHQKGIGSLVSGPGAAIQRSDIVSEITATFPSFSGVLPLVPAMNPTRLPFLHVFTNRLNQFGFSYFYNPTKIAKSVQQSQLTKVCAQGFLPPTLQALFSQTTGPNAVCTPG